MSPKHDKILSNRDKSMSDVFYAKSLFEEAFPLRRYGSVKAMLYEAHKFVSRRVHKEFTPRRARSIWEGKARRIDGEEMDALRAAVIEESKVEQRELRSRLAALDEMLASIDANETSKALARQSKQNGRLGRVDRF